MARLGDVPKLFKSVGVLEFIRRVWRQVSDDNLFTWAAALAYAWLFALFPFILFLLALIPYLPFRLRVDAEHNVEFFLTKWLPADAAKTLKDNINGNVNNLLHQPKGLLLYSGLVVALWAASSGMASTMSALDKCYELDRGRPYHRHRAVATMMTIVVMLLLLVVACLLPVGSAVREWVIARGLFKFHHAFFIAFDIVRWVLALVFMFSVLAIVYYLGPNIKHRFSWITPGAVFSVLVWVLLGVGFRIYVDRVAEQSYARTYGTLGGVAILMLLFYIDALVLLIGAEINSEIDFEVLKVRRGTRDLRHAENSDAPAPTAI
jgi:membrane protein